MTKQRAGNRRLGDFGGQTGIRNVHSYLSGDIDGGVIGSRRVAILGYGAQGRAQALNLNDEGVDTVVGLRAGSQSIETVRADGLAVAEIPEAVASADLVMFMLPDEVQPQVWTELVEPHMREGAGVGFAHGFNIHYQRIQPRKDLDVILVAPKGAAQEVRGAYQSGSGVVFLVAVAQDPTGQALQLALSYAGAQGAGRVGILPTTFREETETDLFGEQAVLCGGLGELVLAGFETLTDAGYPAELAYFECLHELKFIIALLQEGGFGRMHEIISTTAAYGAVTRGPQLVNEDARARMAGILADIQSGRFAEEFLADGEKGSPVLAAARDRLSRHPIEHTGEALRRMMRGD